MKRVLLALLLTAAFSLALAKADEDVHPHCGTIQMISQFQEQKTGSQGGLLASTYPSGCTASDYYDSVYTKKTSHFQIFYTLDGPHATTLDFIDSVATDAELAYKFYTGSMGMLPPLGIAQTTHYQQDVESGLYPIEIIDIDLIRGMSACHGCYGLTLPDNSNTETSELLIDNDFQFTPSGATKTGTYVKNGKSCSYNVATEELMNSPHGYSYADHWEKGIRVTAFHELYHAVQVRYLDMYTHTNFWFEASAAGMEELTAPDIDDYFVYLPSLATSKNLPLNQLRLNYAAGILLIYLHNFVNAKTDKYIWENFKSNPNGTFQEQLKKFVDKNQLSIDSIFQDFSTRLSFAGNRSQLIDSTELICTDEASWQDFSYELVATNDNRATFKPSINNFAYMFYSNGKPMLEDFTGRASAVLYKDKSSEIINLASSNEADPIFEKAFTDPAIDSIAWVFSNFNSSETIPTIISDSTLRAYPVPWREGNLCFTPLPKDKHYVEIRNRRGNLVSRENYEGTTYCISEDRVRELMVPGVYRFRAGNHGKTKDFIIIY